jgi:hypothetical protein
VGFLAGRRVAPVLFTFFLIIYVGLLLTGTKFATIDDFNFLDTIQTGKFLPFSRFSSYGGRFYPLDGWEYNWVTRVLPAQPFSYYLFNAIELVAFVAGFYWLLRRLRTDQTPILMTLALVLTTNNFFHAFFRLLVPERGSIFCFTVFLCAFFSFVEAGKWWSFCLSIIAANFALYYKEPGFLMLGSFALCHLIFSWKHSKSSLKILDGLLLLSSGIFLLVYVLVVAKQPSGTNYATMIGAKDFLKVLRYNTTWDPIFAFCLFPSMLLRSFQLVIEKRPTHPIYDAMLCGALVYTASFFYLGIYSVWYLVPTYIFAIPALFYYASQLKDSQFSSRKLTAVIVIATALFYKLFSYPPDTLALVFPNTLPNLNRHRLVPINYDKTLDFLVEDIRKEYSGKRANIFLNVNRNGGYEAYQSLSLFLNYRGLSSDQFDLHSDTSPNNFYNLSTVNSSSPYSVFRNADASRIHRGDYLVILPTAFYGSISELRSDAFGKTSPGACALTTTKDYKLVFHTETPWAFPWNAWDLAGLVNFALGHSKQPTTHCGTDLNYYILIHR